MGFGGGVAKDVTIGTEAHEAHEDRDEDALGAIRECRKHGCDRRGCYVCNVFGLWLMTDVGG